MINVSQRQAGLAILGIASCSSWVALFLILVAQGGSFTAALPVLIGCVLFTSLLVVYLRDERLGRLVFPVLIVVFTAVITFGLPDEFVTDQVSLAILTPSLLSLVLLDTPWIVGVGAATIIGLLLRAQGHGPLNAPVTLLIYATSVLMIALSRLVTNTAQRAAEGNARRAETAQVHAEQQARELAEANELMTVQLDQQQQLLDLVATLETPAVPLAEGVLFAPIVGHIDARRAQQLTSRLLQEASEQRARLVVLDIAGVSVIDTGVARALLGTTQALRLLGCKVTISGISASVAMTLIHLGINLDEVTTARSPQEALSQYLTKTTLPIQGNENGSASYN